MATEGNKDRIRGLFDEVWSERNPEAAARFYAAGPILDGVQDFARALYGAFPD